MKRSERRASRDSMRTETETRTGRQQGEQKRGVLGPVKALADHAFPAGDIVLDDRGGEKPVPRDSDSRGPRST
jgi:hypothetical protein